MSITHTAARVAGASAIAATTLLFAGTALAASTPPSGHGWSAGMHPAVFGSVTAISGATLTVDSKGFGKSTAETTYTVDASSATVTKDNATSTVSAIAVGDMIMATGSVSGTSVTATSIRDGMPGGPMMRGPGRSASSTPSTLPQGNGEPVVGGSVTAVSGSTITVTNKENVTYTVDASGATVTKAGSTAALSDIATGDALIVQGTVSGTAVTASSIFDQGAQSASNSSGNGKPKGLFGAVGGFFSRLLGFF